MKMKLPYKNFTVPLLKIAGLITLILLVGKIFPEPAGVALCLLLIGGYYGLIARCTKFCKVNFLDIFKSELIGILLVAAVSLGFIVFIVSSHQTIYIWDSLETWEPTILCEETVFSHPYQALRDLRASINHADYNNFLPILMALPMHIFGKSFLCYTLYVWIMFALPAIFFAAATLKTFLNDAGIKIPCFVLMAIFLLFPVFEVPLFIGYANVSILLPAALILAMLLSLEKEFRLEPLILIGVLCIFAVFQARTAAYMILGEFFGYTVYVIISGVRDGTFPRDFFLLCKRFFCIGISALIITLPLFFTFVKRAVTYDIATAYSAYQFGQDFSVRFLNHTEELGVLIYGLFLFGAAYSFFNKKFLPLAAFLLTWEITSAFLFCRVQSMGWQHFYIMILPFAMLIAVLTAEIFREKKSLGAVLIFILAFNFLQTYCIPFQFGKVFNYGYIIPVRHDIDDLKNFVADMNNLTAGTDKKIYLLASSTLYNYTVIGKIFVPEKHNAMPNLLVTADVDLRDGFPVKFFDADYVIVVEPIQTHLLPRDQSVVVKPAELILNPLTSSTNFKQIKEYTFYPESDGISSVTFKVYEKISPFDKSDIDFVEKIFVELYPDKDDLFKNRFEKYKREKFKD